MSKVKLVQILGFYVLVFFALNAPIPGRAEPVVLDGLIEPYLTVNLGSPVPGIIETVDADRGDRVTKGQVLAKLVSGVEKATVELARFRSEMKSAIKAKEAKLNFSLRRQKRMEQLHKKSVIPFEEMDEARTNSDLALLELEEVKEDKRLARLELGRSIEVLNRLTIYSPISGVVMERFLTQGEYIEDQPILKLAQIDPLNVEVFVPVELLDRIKTGMLAEVVLEKPSRSVHKAKVKIIDRVGDAASGTFGVRLEMPNPDYKLSAGMKCKVSFSEKK